MVMSNELRSAIDPPSSPLEKVAWLALGLAVGYFLPFLLSHLLLQVVPCATVTLACRTSVLLASYFACVPLAWLVLKKRFLAIGLVIPALIQLVLFAAAVVLWLTVRVSGR